MNRVGKGSIVNTLKKNPKLLLDWEVTVDTRNHSGTGNCSWKDTASMQSGRS
jgi:hypothetical protein